MNKEVIFLLVR